MLNVGLKKAVPIRMYTCMDRPTNWYAPNTEEM